MPPRARVKAAPKTHQTKSSKTRSKELDLSELGSSSSSTEASQDEAEGSRKPSKRKAGPAASASAPAPAKQSRHNKRARPSTPPDKSNPSDAASSSSDEDHVSDLKAENARLRASVAELQESFDALYAKRHTAPEAALQRLQQASDDRAASSNKLVQQYKAEVEQLHRTLSDSVPKSSKTAHREMQQKDAEVARLKKELHSTRSNIAERDQTIKELQQELQFEVSQSKSLMSKTKASAATGSNAHSAPAPATTTTTTSTSTFTAASSGAGDANADSQAMLELSTDLTGLLISSTYAEAEGQAFECLLSDVRGRPRDLAFKLVLHPADEQGQQSVSYWPKIDKARDKEVDALLEEHFKTLMRFDRTQAGRFFRKAWLAVCK